MAFDSPQAATADIKKVSHFFGADLCGVTTLDPRWLYASRVDVRDMSEVDIGLPEGLSHVIVLGHEMDQELVRTYPSALGGAATGREYSHEAATVMQVAAYIRNLGPPKVGGGASSIQGVKKWTSDAEKCFSFWTKLSSDCAICMRVCPFNREFSSWPHRLWLRLALSRARRVALWLDRYRVGRLKPSSWWERR